MAKRLEQFFIAQEGSKDRPTNPSPRSKTELTSLRVTHLVNLLQRGPNENYIILHMPIVSFHNKVGPNKLNYLLEILQGRTFEGWVWIWEYG
jgi:hypothetical protein